MLQGSSPRTHKQALQTHGRFHWLVAWDPPREVELLGEFSPLDCLTAVHGSQHDLDHELIATHASTRPDDLDAKHDRSAMQTRSLGLDAPAALDASSGPALSELPPRATTEQATTNTYTCYCARNWARHDDDKQQEVFVLFLAVLMLLSAPAALHERGAPTTSHGDCLELR